MKKRRILSLLLTAITLMSLAVVPASAAEGSPAVSSNIGAQDYTTYGKTVRSHLFQNETGGLTRVEYTGSQIVVEDYSSDFAFQSSRTIPMELSIWGASSQEQTIISLYSDRKPHGKRQYRGYPGGEVLQGLEASGPGQPLRGQHHRAL